MEVKKFLFAPLILALFEANSSLTLYLSDSEKALSSTLVLDGEKREKPIYSVSKVFKVAEIRYQKIEKLALALITTAWKLCHYFQGQSIVIKTNYFVKQILKKPDLAGIMVSWAIELSKYDITFESKSAIKSKLLAPCGIHFTRRGIIFHMDFIRGQIIKSQG